MRLVSKYAKAYAICVVVFSVLMVFVSLVPKAAIQRQVEESADILLEEGDYPAAWPTMHGSPDVLDSFTTSLSLNIAWHAVGNPVVGGFLGSYYIAPNWEHMNQNLADGMNQEGQIHYFRYWHGYLTILVPLLTVFDIAQIRKVLMFVTILLAAAVLALLGRKARLGAGLAWGAALLLVNIWNAVESTAQSFCFIVAFAAALYVLRKTDNEAELGEDVNGVFFFVVGAVTVFLDFLDTPTVSLGLPLAIYAILSERRIAQASAKTILACFLRLAVAWAAGYALLWGTKWGIGLLVLGGAGMSELSAAITQRAGSTITSGETVTRLSVLKRNLTFMMPKWMILITMGAGVVWVALTCFFRRAQWHKLGLALLFVALIPVAWYFVLPNHAHIHWTFTYRTLCTSVFALGLMMTYLTDWEALHTKVANILPKRAQRG